MIVSWNWLTDYLRLDIPVELLTDRLALTGLNLESIEDIGGDIEWREDPANHRLPMS